LSATADAVDLARLTGPLVGLATSLEKGEQVTPENQSGALIVARSKPGLDPGAYGVAMDTESPRDFFHRIAPVDLGQARV